MSEKLHKVLARAGLGSRRQMEEWIAAGRVTVDGKAAALGDRVSEGQRIRVDGRPVAARSLTRDRVQVLVYHKPEGEVCTRSDPEGRTTVFERLPVQKQGRWVAVGRLDVNTSGLMLFTNDGELANRLMHPSSEVEREYAVRVRGGLTPEVRSRLLEGVVLEDGPASFGQVVDAGGRGTNYWYHVTLKEGRNREVRRMLDAVGVTVSRLIRIRFGDIRLPPRLKAGRWQELEDGSVRALLTSAGLTQPGPRRSRDGPSGTPRRPRRQRR